MKRQRGLARRNWTAHDNTTIDTIPLHSATKASDPPGAPGSEGAKVWTRAKRSRVRPMLIQVRKQVTEA